MDIVKSAPRVRPAEDCIGTRERLGQVGNQPALLLRLRLRTALKSIAPTRAHLRRALAKRYATSTTRQLERPWGATII